MKFRLAAALLGLVMTAHGTSKSVISSSENEAGPNHSHLAYDVSTNISVESSRKMAPIVGGYDAGTRGLPGYNSPEKLLSLSPRNHPEVSFKNPITELLLDRTYDFGSYPHTTGKTRDPVDKTEKKDISKNAEDKFLGNTEKESLPEDNEVELLTDESTMKKIEEGTVGTSYNVGSGQGGSVNTQAGLPEFPVGVEQDNPGIGIPGLNQPGFLFRIPGYISPESSQSGHPYGVPGTNTFGPDSPFKVPGIHPVNTPPGFAFTGPEAPVDISELPSSSNSGQGSQSGDHGTTVILESGPIFIKERSPNDLRPTSSRPSRFKPQFDDHNTESGFDYVLSYG